MRLNKVERGHRFKHKLLMGLMRVMSGHPAPDVVKTILYRPEFFGRYFSALCQSSLRGPSTWSVGERELFAAFTSRLNQCRF